jgi:hypothetical protein
MRFVWPVKHVLENPSSITPPRSLPNGGAYPDFLCVGAQRSGTTWLYRHLHLHTDFWMPPRKELHYFDQLCRARRFGPPRNEDERDLRFVEAMQRLGDKPFMDLEGYGRLFELKGALISGDITPAYSTLNEEIIAQIMKRFPKIKVIFLARDPVERALSQLSMHVQLKLSLPFDVTDVEEVIRRLLRPGVLLRSHPSKIVARWRRHVPPEQFRIYFYEELERTPAALFRSIVCFLGGDSRRTRARLNRKEKVNSTGKLRFPNQVRFQVARFFEPELKACAAELGGPATGWPERYGLSVLMSFFSIFEDVLDLIVSFDWAV